MAATTDRRSLLKSLAVASTAAAAATAPAAAAREKKVAPPEALGMLYDATRCIGCKTCVVACREANNLEPDTGDEGLWQKPVDLNGRTKNIIKLYKEGERVSYMKAQCMHCVDPACAAACMLHSLSKDPVTGVVGYDVKWCVGCRYCQMACPFNVPKFEFDKAAPKIVKCELCRHRAGDAQLVKVGDFTRYPKGHGSACCEVCPREAVIAGKRDELLAEAKRRIAANPGMYFENRVYGEVEGGGTQVLYLSNVPFDKLGLPSLGPDGVPQTCYTVQEGLYKGFAAPVALYAVLAGVMLRNRRAGGASEEAGK
ncbi:MAG: hydrogenase 2 operon protein HybA [Holophagales bacterium]|nr:MAG: hydrogenase 2 operon protein HybA [Holophagales bacterium]